MKTKQKGKCPFCGTSVEAVVVEENTVRRDKCQCPACSQFVYLCRSPGCHDYAKGTSVYDHELCPECTETAAKLAAEVGAAAVKVAVTVASTAAVAIVTGGKKK